MDRVEVILDDESAYGKNSGFYETWFKDCDAVKMMV